MARSGDAILVIDAGTTSTRALAFAPDGTVLATAQAEITQFYPKPGWVEHDAGEIWTLTCDTARQVVGALGGPGRIAAIGITNQRETVVAWDKASGEPLARAIVWQDRRTADTCAALREGGDEAFVQERTGLLLDPYFSATKMAWLLQQDEAVRAAAGRGNLALGTIESWLVFKLTGGAHLSDASNASRTLLLPLTGAGFDPGLCELFQVPAGVLPEVVDTHGQLATTSADVFGAPIAITGLIGDQQSATIGQGCLSPGQTKATYGTGAFVLANMGTTPPVSKNRLLATVLSQSAGTRHFALEGSIFVAGSLIQWLRDSLGVIASAPETEGLARSVEDSGGVVIVPALSGLGAPHWRSEARGLISGLTFATGKAQLARAALEAMAHQTHDLASAFAADGARWSALAIDGGMSANDWMAQDIADVIDLAVERPAMVETTALGAAILAGAGCGLFESLDAAANAMRGPVTRFAPAMDEGQRATRLQAWHKALATV
jgi:glycerol kinase